QDPVPRRAPPSGARAGTGIVGRRAPPAVPHPHGRNSKERAMKDLSRRLVIVVRADPVICGHSGEARNLAEAALSRGFDEVRILSWPLDLLERAGLPLKPYDTILPYSP